MSRPTEFTMTEDHVRLLRCANVGWQDCETGAPEIDPKRPYGNSYVPGDVAEILGWVPRGGDVELTDDQRADAYAIHRETGLALQIVLITGQMEPGRYAMAKQYDYRSWQRVSP